METPPVADREDRFAAGASEYGADEAQRILLVAGGTARRAASVPGRRVRRRWRRRCRRVGRPEFVQRDAGQDRNRFHADKDSASRGQKQTKPAALPRRRLSKRKLVFRKVQCCGQKQTEFAVLPRRSIYGAVKVRFFRCQSAAGGGCVVVPVAGRCSPPHGAAAGCRSSGF